ncbi:hypothetical protein R1sor_005763 [Riccia sorocarpa]|uniref:Transmembrane protein n=1 Tax=Riccia sorocarpa TaxID=122646 RepID=A0ABD3HP16_9MARC
MYRAEVLWRYKVFLLGTLFLGLFLVLGIECFTTSGSRYVAHIEVFPAVSIRDGSAEGYDGWDVGRDPQPQMSRSGKQILAVGGRKLLATMDNHVQELEPFMDFDYPGPGGSTPVDPPPVMSLQTAAAAKVHMHVDYADPGTHPPGDDDSDEPPIHEPPYPA